MIERQKSILKKKEEEERNLENFCSDFSQNREIFTKFSKMYTLGTLTNLALGCIHFPNFHTIINELSPGQTWGLKRFFQKIRPCNFIEPPLSFRSEYRVFD